MKIPNARAPNHGDSRCRARRRRETGLTNLSPFAVNLKTVLESQGGF